MDDVAVLLEHVDLLDALEGLDVQLLKGGLELLVVGTGVADNLLDLTAGSTLATEKSQYISIKRGRPIADASKCEGFAIAIAIKQSKSKRDRARSKIRTLQKPVS